MKLGQVEAAPSVEFVTDLQDEEDEEGAALLAARLTSDAMMAREMARRAAGGE